MGCTQGFGVAFAQRATLEKYFPAASKFVRSIPFIQFLIFSFCLFFFQNYNAVKVQITAGLIPVMIGEILAGIKNNIQSAKLIGFGISISIFSAAAHTFKISLSPWFNHNDISHIFIITSLVLMYRGVAACESDTGANTTSAT